MSILWLLSIVCVTRVSCRYMLSFSQETNTIQGTSVNQETKKIVRLDNMFFIVLLMNDDFLVLELYLLSVPL